MNDEYKLSQWPFPHALKSERQQGPLLITPNLTDPRFGKC